MSVVNIRILDNINKRLYSQNHEANKVWRSTQPDIDDLTDEVHRAISNTRATLADIGGIEMLERTYRITPDLERDTLEERRERILDMMRDQPPFTEAWLKGNDFDVDIDGILAEKFPNGDVSAQLKGLRLSLVMDISEAGLNERGFVNRAFRELLPWFRRWIPSNVLLLPIAKSYRPKVETEFFVAGRGFVFSTRELRHATSQYVGKSDVTVAGIGFSFSVRIAPEGETPRGWQLIDGVLMNYAVFGMLDANSLDFKEGFAEIENNTINLI